MSPRTLASALVFLTHARGAQHVRRRQKPRDRGTTAAAPLGGERLEPRLALAVNPATGLPADFPSAAELAAEAQAIKFASGLPADMTASAYLFIGDHSVSNSEIWRMNVADRPLTAPRWGEVRIEQGTFARGVSYPITVDWLATNRAAGPDYDYRAWVDRSANPTWTSGSPTPSSPDFFVTDPGQLLQRRWFGSDVNATLDKTAELHFPGVDLDVDSDNSGYVDGSPAEDALELDSTTGVNVPVSTASMAGLTPLVVGISDNLRHAATTAEVSFSFSTTAPTAFRLWRDAARTLPLPWGTAVTAAQLGLGFGGRLNLQLEAVTPTTSFAAITTTALVTGSSWQGTLQDTVRARGVPGVDLDVDSDNTGSIARSIFEDSIEDDPTRPGVLVPVGLQRTPIIVDVPAGCTASLVITQGADKVRLWPAPTGGTAIAATGTTIVGGPPQTFWIEAFAPSATMADIAFTLTATGGSPASADMIRATAVAVDIDVDSNNDGRIGEDDDLVEDVDAGDNANVGARVFQNIDDDDHNQTMDKADGLFIRPGVEDLDLTEAVLGTSNLAVLGNPQQNADTYRLWLGVPAGLNVFADRRRTPLNPDGTDGTWRYWTVAQDGSSTFPKKVFIEGLVIGEHEVIWQLCKPNAPGQNGPPQQSLSRDVVDISVEEMVFPTVDQRVANVYSKPTSQWDGFALKEEYPWIIEKPLVDFIKAKEPVGWLETTYKQPTGQANAPSLESRQTANNGSFTIEFEYEYDHSRGENGWVAANKQQKISFVANSGVKFGSGYSTEIALLDVRAMVDRATITTNDVAYTGLDAFNPEMGKGITGEGKVVVDGLDTASEQEEIARLLTGVAYNRDYAGVTDAPAMPPNNRQADDYFQVLKAVYDRVGAAARGSLKATYAGASSTLTIWLNGQQTYNRGVDSPQGPLPDVGEIKTLQLQSHWGSGVRFKNIKISV